MAETVALVDYGAGNLHSVENALRAAGAEAVTVTSDPNVVRAADRIVLPGVGAFAACARALRGVPHLIEAMTERVHVGGAPFLGICVGMQLLATRGVEHGATPGLDWIAGEVLPIHVTDPAIKIPHMGWNDVAPTPHPDGAELIEHWFHSIAQAAGITLHVELLYGQNNHHVCEAIYKGFARAMRQAVSIDARKADAVPSTKGMLGG